MGAMLALDGAGPAPGPPPRPPAASRPPDGDCLGGSGDDVASHRQWAAELGGVPFPLLADPGGAASRAWGVLNEQDGGAWRGAFVVSPQGRVGSVPGGRGGGGRAGG